MQLRQLDIQGFKSFARPTSFIFYDGITALIGPNGAGKSCVADAIRWALGEQSIKSLRGKSSADVIFAGNDWHKRAQMARVTLTFDNEAGHFEIEAPQVTITRVYTRQGEGEYLINGDPIRLIDMQRMLAEARIGVKSYAVISQGMVDQYLTASPQGRRELFDEATGVKALKIKLKV